MSDEQTGILTLSARANAALQSRNVPESLALFGELCAAPEATAEMHLGHAYAHRAAKDVDGMLAALDRALALDGTNVRALILKADGLLEKGDRRAAPVFYAAALRAAPPNPAPTLARDLERAQDFVIRAARDYEDFLRAKLSAAGFSPGRSSARFANALEMLFGHAPRPVTAQRPRIFYLPGLPEYGFHPESDTPWMPALEAETAAIRAELQEVLRAQVGFAPYIQRDPRTPRNQQKKMADNPDWSAFYLWKTGQEITENSAKCPRTAAALRALPLCDMPSRGPMALFSWLKPGAHIPPHTGMLNTRMICHLPLIVPPGCRFRVGPQTRDWVEGRGWAFDDTFVHEAWNPSDQLRVILIFDVWRPDVTAEERHLINAMLSAIDEYAGAAPKWEI
jgi:aspartyl/asparaginyl beta-hydroxylase (cupin superfamily)